MGYGDLSCYGNEDIETPNIDRLAKEGTKFTNFYVNSPICSPSRVAFTTGRYPTSYGVTGHFSGRKQNREREMPDFLDPKAPSVARAFHDAGYATAHFGKWHQGGGRDVDDAPHPKAYGFDESLVSFEGLGDRILPTNLQGKPDGLARQSANLKQGKIEFVPKYEMTRIYVDRAIDFVERNRAKPFYMHIWLNDVHDPFFPRPGSLEKYAKFADQKYVQQYYAVIDEMDRQ